jgi:acyl-coenzyme A thioesterase PaaI-like protein
MIAALISFWPPFWFTGIRFTRISSNFRQVTVRMALRFYNKNVVGIQYGGNLFSMTDPCYMMMLMHNLGKAYKIIDQSAAIAFTNPGLGAVTATCCLEQADIDDIITATKNGDKYLKTFTIDIIDTQKQLVAKVTRVVYIRKRIDN